MEEKSSDLMLTSSLVTMQTVQRSHMQNSSTGSLAKWPLLSSLWSTGRHARGRWVMHEPVCSIHCPQTKHFLPSPSKADLQQDHFRSGERLRNEWLLVQILWLLSNPLWKWEESNDDGSSPDAGSRGVQPAPNDSPSI